MHARGDEREALTVQEETSSEVVISLAFDQRGVLDVPLVHGPDPVWSAWRARSARGRPLRPPLSRPRGTVRVFKEHNTHPPYPTPKCPKSRRLFRSNTFRLTGGCLPTTLHTIVWLAE